MKRLAIAALIGLLVAPASAAPATYAIDVLLPLTGPAAFAGNSQALATRLYEAIVNKTGGIHGQPLHFEIHDDQGSPAVAVQIANDVLAKHPIVVVGPNLTATCAAVAPLFANGPVDFCISPVLEPPHGGYVFASSIALRNLIAGGYARMRALGYKRFAALNATDASGAFEVQVTKDWFGLPENKNVQLVAQETFAPADISVAAQVAKIKAANPDILYVWATGTAFATVIRELANAGLNVPVVTPPSNTSAAQLAQDQSFLPKTLVTSGMPYQGRLGDTKLRAAAAEYLDAVRDAGLKPDTFQAYVWDPLKLVVTVLRSLPENATPAQFHAALENLHDVAGIWGTYDFRTGDQHGITGKEIPYIVWDPSRASWTFFDTHG